MEQKIRKKLTDARHKTWVKEYHNALKEKIGRTCKSLLPVYFLHFENYDEDNLVSHIEEIKDIDRLTECSSDYYRMYDTYEGAYTRALEIINDDIKELNSYIEKTKEKIKFLEERRKIFERNFNNGQI